MSDLTSKQDVINEIHKYFAEEIDKTPHALDEDGYDVYTDMATVNSLLKRNKELSKRIKALPSAERYTGKWIKMDEYICNECGYNIIANVINYCPNCDAKIK